MVERPNSSPTHAFKKPETHKIESLFQPSRPMRVCRAMHITRRRTDNMWVRWYFFIGRLPNVKIDESSSWYVTNRRALLSSNRRFFGLAANQILHFLSID